MDKLMLMNDQLNAVVWGKYMIFFFIVYGLLAHAAYQIPSLYPCTTDFA